MKRKVQVLPASEWHAEFSTWITQASKPVITTTQNEPGLGLWMWLATQRPVELGK